MIPLFVYGTLKKNKGNNWLLSSAEYQGGCLTVKPYPLFSLAVPIIFDVDDPKANNVYGELYHLHEDEDIYPIDALEGHPECYERKIIQVAKYDGTINEAWCYFMNIFMYEDIKNKYPNIMYQICY